MSHNYVIDNFTEITVNSTESPPIDNWAVRGKNAMYDTLPPCMIVTGVLANVYAFIVLLRQRLRKLIVHLPLTILAIVDAIVLLTGLLRHWLRKATYFDSYENALDPQIISNEACKIFEFILYWSLTFSAWLVTLVSVERFVTICLSLDWQIRRFLTSRKGLLVVIAIIGVLLALLDVHIFWTRNLKEKNGKYSCENINPIVTEMVFPKLDLIVTAVLPFSVITVCNSSILCKLRNVRRNSTISASQSKLGSYRTTVMLLLTTFSFILLTLPVKMYLLIFQTPSPKLLKEIEDEQTRNETETYYRFFWCLFLHLQFLNHCCNFWLYCASNPQFRREALMVLMFCHRKGSCNGSSKSTYVSSSVAHIHRNASCREEQCNNIDSKKSRSDHSCSNYSMRLKPRQSSNDNNNKNSIHPSVSFHEDTTL